MARHTDNGEAADEATRLEQRMAEQDVAESLAADLADSDTASELLHDHAVDDGHSGRCGVGRRRLLLGLLGLLAVAMGGARRARRRR